METAKPSGAKPPQHGDVMELARTLGGKVKEEKSQTYVGWGHLLATQRPSMF